MVLKLTERASEEVKRFIEDSGGDTETKLRIGVTGGGCSGFNYSLELSEDFDEENDNLDKQHDILIAIDKKSALFLDEVTLDYIDEIGEAGFSFINPNAKSCGCGKSFNPNV